MSAVVPAAGRGDRFGGGKLIAPIRGEPLLTHTLRSLLDGGVRSAVVVTARETRLAGVFLLADPRVMVVVNADPTRGMWSSVQVGLAAVRDEGPVLVLPGDMPFVSAATVAAVARRSADTGAAVVPVYAGRRGHPIALPDALRHTLLAADPASNLKAALAGLGAVVLEVDVDDPGILQDVDVKADLRPRRLWP